MLLILNSILRPSKIWVIVGMGKDWRQRKGTFSVIIPGGHASEVLSMKVIWGASFWCIPTPTSPSSFIILGFNTFSSKDDAYKVESSPYKTLSAENICQMQHLRKTEEMMLKMKQMKQMSVPRTALHLPSYGSSVQCFLISWTTECFQSYYTQHLCWKPI